MSILTVHNLAFSYRNQPVLQDVSFSLDAGKLLVLLGPNASGKSTLMRLIMGRLRPSAGQIHWQGTDLQRYRPRDLARVVAYLPQSPLADDDQTVFDILRLGRSAYLGAFGIESNHDLSIVMQVAERLQLTDLLDRRLDALSGGQRQRAFLARCLVQEPQAMVLDEPSTYLDLKHQIEMCRLLRSLAHERQLAIVMALHDLNLAATYADELILLQQGRIIAHGSATTVLKPETLSEVYGVEVDVQNHTTGRPVIVINA